MSTTSPMILIALPPAVYGLDFFGPALTARSTMARCWRVLAQGK
jgi:hypothetical protein